MQTIDGETKITSPNIQEFKIQNLIPIIENNDYVKKCNSNKKKNSDSLSSLIRRKLSQSDCIKLGNGLEKVFNNIILQYNTKLKNIKKKMKREKKKKIIYSVMKLIK